jgi:hypothetical protein
MKFRLARTLPKYFAFTANVTSLDQKLHVPLSISGLPGLFLYLP